MPEGLRTPVGIIQQASQQLNQQGVVLLLLNFFIQIFL
jgi:hypothetical protein